MVRICLAALATLCVAANAEPLAPAKAGLADVLSSMEIAADYTDDPLVRVVRISDSGECDETHEASTCPKTQLLIVSSEEIEGPQNPHAWQTPRRIGWQFVRWVGKPDYDGKNRLRAAFEATACEAPPFVESGKVDPRKGGNWHVIRFEISIHGSEAAMRRLTPYAGAKDCDLY